MKRAAVFTLFLLLFTATTCTALASFPSLPQDMLSLQDYTFESGKQFSVYRGPGEDYEIAGNGKAKVSTNGDIQLFGCEDAYALIQYEIHENKCRIGYINMADEDFFVYPTLDSIWTYGRARAKETIAMTDDPFRSCESFATFKQGTEFITLFAMKDWTFVELPSDAPVRGFVPSDLLETILVPYETSQTLSAAVAFLQDSGLEFDVTGLYFNYQNHLYITPHSGGKLYYLDFGDIFDPYNISNWYIEELNDEDAGKLIDHFLNLAYEVQSGFSSEEHLQYGYHDTLGERNIEAVVSNILYGIENEFGRQGLPILYDRLSRRDGNDVLNSLRAQAASRILGKLDHTPVSPEDGCAWYDALTIASQDDLPPDTADYVENELMRTATKLMLAYHAENSPWHSTMDVDAEKTVNIIDLKSSKITKSDSSATIWGVEWYSKYARYDGTRAYNVSGHIIPLKIIMHKNNAGEWTLSSVTYAQDGTLYAPSILAFCDDKQSLANKLMKLPGDGTWNEFLLYLEQNGYDPTIIANE